MRLININMFFIINLLLIFCHFHINKIIIHIGLIYQNILFQLMRFLIFLINYQAFKILWLLIFSFIIIFFLFVFTLFLLYT